jgi:DNA-binding NarL/FixJ family response regulator
MGTGAAPIGVADSVPIYRRGLASVCEQAGLAAIELTPTAEAVSETELAALTVVLRSESEWMLLARSSAELPERPTVAVLPTLEAVLVERAFSAGATGVMEMSASIDHAAGVIRAALEGRALLPRDVEKQLATGEPRPGLPSSTELEWLRLLASGLRVAELADRAGYSEREMYRRLSRLYSRLGVQGRTQALLYVERLGLLAEEDPASPPMPAQKRARRRSERNR